MLGFADCFRFCRAGAATNLQLWLLPALHPLCFLDLCSLQRVAGLATSRRLRYYLLYARPLCLQVPITLRHGP